MICRAFGFKVFAGDLPSCNVYLLPNEMKSPGWAVMVNSKYFLLIKSTVIAVPALNLYCSHWKQFLTSILTGLYPVA